MMTRPVAVWRQLDHGQRRSIVGMAVTAVVLNLIGWGVPVVAGH